MIVWRKSENTNAFGLRGYWVYDKATGDCQSFVTSRNYVKGQDVSDSELAGVELRRVELTVPKGKRAVFERKFINVLKTVRV